ncbi:MAG: alanine:cation symporter family protein [Planctomycetes bacterium]|nr:alanine:cation symporter family protein [Planctomycetota bacterium]
MLLSELTARHLPMECRCRRVTLAALLLVVSVGCHEVSAQQADSTTKDVSAKTERANGSDSGDTASNKKEMKQSGPGDVSVPPTVESLEPAAKPTLLQRVDHVFAQAVKGMEWALFFRVGSRERPYVQFKHEEYYVRDVDAEGSFVKLNPAGVFKAAQLTTKDAEALKARGKLVLGAGAKLFRLGQIGERKVQYVTVIIDDQSKYVLVDEGEQAGKYVKLTGKRGLLSDKPADVLSPEQVEQLGQKGRLAVNDTGSSGDPPSRYIQSETVGGAPVVVLWLALGSVFFTFYMRGVNFWGFRHALQIVRGKYDNPNEPGEVTHFQALSSALSATVGLGNIAGVTIAMTLGGPGAFFWMFACGLFGMTSKFVECTLGQMYRTVKPDGTVLGGPMQYLHVGLKELGLGPLGLVLSIVFAVMCILASFGGGNMFQANQSGQQIVAIIQKADSEHLEQLNADIKQAAEAQQHERMADLQKEKTTLQEEMKSQSAIVRPVFGVLLAIMVGVVIIGGIKRIGAAASKIVPTMCLTYIAACLWIILSHVTEVPAMIGLIFSEAFTPQAMGGGFVGVLVMGVQRAAFSNEAGVGSAAIAHSAARTDQPVREGAVALLGPFIDTIVVCSMTALVILITGAWDNTEWVVNQGLKGTPLTSRAFGEQISFFPYVLTVAVVLFAYSTIISWSYYGERCWERLFGPRSTIVYKAIYVGCVVVGAIVNLGAVLDFSDMMILSMAFPNILGAILLSGKVRAALKTYWDSYRAGEFETFK